MKKYKVHKVQLQAIVTATVWVECDDETEAKQIAENAWRPTCDTTGNAGIDPTIYAVKDWNVDSHTVATYAMDVEQV